jgi:hypothetical protein
MRFAYDCLTGVKYLVYVISNYSLNNVASENI